MIGAGGIGKTSIALTVLHDDRIRRRFGDQRRFIRCDKFPASLTHFLRQLSKTVGAGVENPEDLTPLRPFLSSKDMFIVLDNAESILDPYVMNAQEIYGVVEELGQMSNICICITSRISTSPPDFESLDIPTLSKEAACETFYRIYKRGQRSDSIDSILEQLDFHALSITLLATVAHHNRWDTTRLVKEWDERHTGILQTDHNKSLASAIELSLSSLIFQELGPNARDLLGVIAFFPQGVYESNIDWLFPTISGRKNMLDKFCVLSLAYRNDGFITMLAPIRDYLSPKDPISSPLLISTKNRYFSRLSVQLKTGEPGFEEARWIVSEDVNVEHLLNVFIAADVTSRSVWRACHDFIGHLYWRKPRLVALGPKIEALADDHPSKVRCLVRLSKLLQAVGNHAERERLLTHALKLSQEQGDDHGSTKILRHLSRVWSGMGRHKEGVQQAKRALEISERLGGAKIQARCLISFAKSLYNDKQLGAAEETVYRATNLFTEEGEPSMTVKYHRLLGRIYHSKGDTENAIHHFEVALGIASSRNSLNQQFWIRYGLAELFGSQGRFEDAHAHIERAKSHAADDHDIYLLARAMKVRARFWHRQRSFEEARSEALRAVDVFEKLGAAKHVKRARRLLQRIDDDATRTNGLFDESDEDGELLRTAPSAMFTLFVFRQDHGIRMMALMLTSCPSDPPSRKLPFNIRCLVLSPRIPSTPSTSTPSGASLLPPTAMISSLIPRSSMICILCYVSLFSVSVHFTYPMDRS